MTTNTPEPIVVASAREQVAELEKLSDAALVDTMQIVTSALLDQGRVRVLEMVMGHSVNELVRLAQTGQLIVKEEQ